MAVVDAEKSFHFLIEIMNRTCFRVEIIFKTATFRLILVVFGGYWKLTG